MLKLMENNEISELSRRNAETFNLVVKEQTKRIEEQQKRIDLLNLAVANLTQKLTEVESVMMIQKVKLMGTGPTVK